MSPETLRAHLTQLIPGLLAQPPLGEVEDGDLVPDQEGVGSLGVFGSDPDGPGEDGGPGAEGSSGEDELVTEGEGGQVQTC